jgi:hypothetical protein
MARHVVLRKMTREATLKAANLLGVATDLQGRLWDALLELEETVGVRIDETRDLSDWNIEQIRRCAEDDIGPISWVETRREPRVRNRRHFRRSAGR